MSPRSALVWASILLFLVAFGIRMLFLSSYRTNPEYLQPVHDEAQLLEMAREMVQGKSIPSQAYEYPPLYPAFLAVLYQVTAGNLHLIRTVQIILGSLTVVLLFFLARRFFNWPYACISGLFGACTFYLVFYSCELLGPVLLVLLLITFLIFFLEAYHRNDLKYYLLAGISAGLAVLTTPMVFPAVIGLACTAAIQQKSFGKPLMFALMCVLVILPVTVLNYLSAHDFVMVSTGMGTDFYLGNNPQADGLRNVVTGHERDWWAGYANAREYACKSLDQNLAPSEISAFYFGRSWSWIRSNPGKACALFFIKFYYFFHGFDLPAYKNASFMQYFFGPRLFPFLPYWLISAFALLGFWFSFKETDVREEWRLLNVFTLAYIVTVACFTVSIQDRMPVLPIMLILATLVVRVLITSTSRVRLAYGTVLLVLLGLTNVPIFKQYSDFGPDLVRVSNQYRDQSDLDRAEAFIVTARDYDLPQYRLEYELGLIALARNEQTTAKDHFERALQYQSDYIPAKFHLASIYYKEKKLEQAFDLVAPIKVKKIINDAPLFNLVIDLYFLLGKHDAFVQFLDRATLEGRHQRQLAQKADEMLKGEFFAQANVIYNYLYTKNFKNPQLMNNLGITEYHLGRKDRALFLFTMSDSDEARQNLEKMQEQETSQTKTSPEINL